MTTDVKTTTAAGHVLTRAGKNIVITNAQGDVIGIAPTWTLAERISNEIAGLPDDEDNFDGGDYDREILQSTPEKDRG